MPIVLYNIPARTGNALAPTTVAKLAKIENIVGAKDSSRNFDNMLQYIELTRDLGDFAVLSGNDSLILWNLLAGGTGGIAGCANVFPEVMASIYDLFLVGKIEEAINLAGHHYSGHTEIYAKMTGTKKKSKDRRRLCQNY